jgi:hypothetical protein
VSLGRRLARHHDRLVVAVNRLVDLTHFLLDQKETRRREKLIN